MYPPPADSGPRVQLLPMIAPVTCGIDELADLGLLLNFGKHIYGLMQKRRNSNTLAVVLHLFHDDIIKWNYFPHYWPFVRKFTGHRWFPLTKASARNFDVFFDLRLN